MLMKTVFEHIDYIKAKPHHIRKKVAFTLAASGTAFITVVWLSASVMTGSFAIQGSSFAQSTEEVEVVPTTSARTTEGLAGAAAAFSGRADSEPAGIEIVDTTPAPTKKPEPTILPF